MELDMLEGRIKNAKNTGEDVASTLENARLQFETMQNDAFSTLINGLVDKHAPGVASANAENKITAMLNSSGGADSVRAILAETNNSPVVLGGLKKLYLEDLRNKAFTAGQTSTGAPVTSVAKVRNILKENSGLAASGEIILENDPMLQSVLKTILTSASEGQAKRNAKALPGSSGTPEIQQYQNAINTMINVIVGPLNRIGTQARTAGRLAAEKLDIANRYEIAMDTVVADSNLALKVIAEIEARRATKGIGPFRLPRDLYDEVFSLGIRIGKYAEADREEAYKTWDEYVVDGAETAEDTVEDARSKVKRFSDQTMEMMGLDR
jgi:phosphoribosylcarboxyaminoimidazole (NCAIR) mutase